MKKKLFARAVLPILIILLGWMGMQYLAQLKRPPKKRHPVHEGPLVEVMRARVGDHRVNLLLTGQVEASHELRVVPEVTGRVIWVNPRFERGGFIGAGESFFRVDPVAYEAQKAKALEALKAASQALEEARSRARVAEEEWRKLHGDESPESPLALYGPQLESARARLESATAGYKKAVQDLARTEVRAPFPCVVEEERVEVGGYVRAGEEVARVLGTDAVEVKVPMTLHDFLLLGGDTGAIGSQVTIALWGPKKGLDYSWIGTLDRFLPCVDEKDRMYQAIVVVKDPFRHDKGLGVHLRVNQFVRCLVRGTLLKGVVAIPERALKDEQYVWRVGPSNTLEIIPVEIVERKRGKVYVRGPIRDGDLLVLSGITGAANGLKVRPVEVQEGIQQ